MQGETVRPGGQDNCTVELIEIDNSPWPNSEFENYSPQSKGRKSKSSKKRLSLVFVIVALVLAISAVVGLSWTPLQIRGLEKKISQLQEECSEIDTVTSFNIMEKKSNDLKEAKNKIEQASNNEARKAAETGCKEKQKLYDDSENKHNEKVNSFKFKQSRLQELQEKKEKLQQRCIIYKNGKNESNNNRKK